MKDGKGSGNQEGLEQALDLPEPRCAAPVSLAEEYRLHADFVYRSLQRLGVRIGELADALQEVFLVAHRRLAEFDPARAKFSTWLFGICVRVAWSHKRRRTMLPLEDMVLSDAQTPERACLGREGIRRLCAALDALTPELRATFVLFELEGESCASIATLFDVPVGTVYSRLHTARESVRQAFEERMSTKEGHLP